MEVEIAVASPEHAQEICTVHKLTWLNTYPNEEHGVKKEFATRPHGVSIPELIMRKDRA